jgi:Cys-tRNA(Pro) deacylase
MIGRPMVRTDAAHPNVARVIAAARDAGLTIEVVRFPEGTRTAADAARAVGCDVGQIVKSLVFMADGAPVIALVSGANRLDAGRLATALAVAEIRRADGDEVRSATGYAIGGVPPFGHASALTVAMDRDLTRHTTLWAAAGLPDAVFEIRPGDLERASGATVADLAERS